MQSILALTLAKAAAIVPGQVLTNEEMTGLVDGLFAVATPNYTPDGKTVLSVINEDDLENCLNNLPMCWFANVLLYVRMVIDTLAY